MKDLTNNQMDRFLTPEFWLGWLSIALAYVLSFLAPIWAFCAVIFVFLGFDMWTGRKAAIKRGEKVSRSWRRSLAKAGPYFILVIASEMMRMVFSLPVNVTYITAFAVVITEFQSIVENVEEITGVNIWTRIKDAFVPKK